MHARNAVGDKEELEAAFTDNVVDVFVYVYRSVRRLFISPSTTKTSQSLYQFVEHFLCRCVEQRAQMNSAATLSHF